MKIAQVVHWFLPRHLAGVEVYTYNLAKELQKRHQVDIYCREDGYTSHSLYETDENYQGVPLRRVYFNLLGTKYHPLNLALIRFRNPALEASFGRFLDEKQPDIVHIQHLLLLSGGLVSVAKSRGLPVVVTLHDYWFQCRTIQLLRPSGARCSGPAGGWKCAGCVDIKLPYPLRLLFSPLTAPLFVYRTAYLSRQLEMVDLITSPSAFVRDRFIDHGLPADRILLSDYGTADDWLADLNPQPSTRLRFGFIGSVMHHKGIHTLVQAFNLLDSESAELHIFGDPAFSPHYYNQVQTMAVSPGIHFHGRIENDEIGRALGEIDVLIVPPIWYENSPISIHEAQLAGTPVIGSRIGGIPELVEHDRSGLLFAPGDAGDLCRQMQKFLNEPELLGRLRQGIRPPKTMEQDALEYEVVYERLIARGDL